MKPSDGEQPDSDVRELAFKKNQYGPTAETILLRYQRGLFLPERGMTSLDKLAREARVMKVFLRGLGQIIQQGRDAIAAKNSPDFGPALIVTVAEAKADRISKTELTDAMARLLTSGKSTSARPTARHQRQRTAFYRGEIMRFALALRSPYEFDPPYL